MTSIPKVDNQVADNRYLRYFCYLLILEVYLLGSGQEVHVAGFLTLRMVNFIIAVGISVIFFLRSDDMPKTILWLLLVYTILLVFSVFEASLRCSDVEKIVEDVKPLTYFYILPFYYYISSSERILHRAYTLIMVAAEVMTVLYLIYMVLTDVLNIIPYTVAYQTLETDSILFRGVGSAFYYKGFIFLPIAAVGFLRERKYIWLILSCVAIYFSYTRGLYVLLVFGLVFYYMKTHRVDLVKILLFALVVFLLYQLAAVFEVFSFGDSFKANREDSDITRVLIVEQVLDAVTYWSFFIGHGFGYGIAERSVHMEVAYMDIFHKQGILGIAFWFTLLAAVIRYGQQVGDKHKDMADFWVTATLMMYLQSCFNPYINTPMGMTVIFIALVYCYRYAQDEHPADSSPVQG